MKPEIAKKWIAALRSGEYKQTTGSLRNGNAFCCLGVLCNLHAQAHPHVAEGQDSDGWYMGSSAILPTHVKEWAGMRSHDGSRVGAGVTLASLNDAGKRFPTIAKIIEANVEAL